MKKLLSWLILCSSFFACSTSEEKNADTRDYKEICSELDGTDKAMLDLITEIEQKFENDELFIDRFTKSQVYWVQYRDRHLRALYPKDWSRFYRKNHGIERFNGCKCQELNRMTLNRIEELQMYLQGGPEEQANCPSTWNERKSS